MKLFRPKVPEHIGWMTRDRAIGSVTYHEHVRRWGWTVISVEGKKKRTWLRGFWLNFITKFLHVMFRMEKLTGGPG